MSTVRKILKNFVSLTFADLFSKGLTFFGVVYLARILGAEGFGKIEFAQAMVVFFLLASNQGLSTLGTREIAKGNGEVKTYANHILAMRLLLAVMSYFLLVIFTLLVRQPTEVKNLLLLYGFTLFTFSLSLDWIFQGIEKMEYVALSRIANQIVYVAGLFILVKNSNQFLRVPIIKVGSAVVAAAILFYIFVKIYGYIVLHFDASLWKQILKHSIPIGISFMLIKVYYTFDTVMLGFMKGDMVVGWYNAAYKIVLLFVGFANLFGAVIFPVLSRTHKESIDQFKRLVLQFSRLTILFGLPIAVGGTIMGSQIIQLVYGSLYHNSILPLQLLIWSVFTVYLNSSFAFCLLSCDRQKDYMYSVLAGALTNLVLNFALIPKYGMLGAGVATITCEVVVLGFILFYSMRVIRVFPGIFLLKALGASIIMGVVLHLFHVGLAIKLLAGTSIYLAAMIALRGITGEDLGWLKQNLKVV